MNPYLIFSIFFCLNNYLADYPISLEGEKYQQTTLTPGRSSLIVFTGKPPKEHQQIDSVFLLFDEEGEYTLTLSNANTEYSGHWLYWDVIQLKDNGKVIWGIGDRETPENYSKLAFDEFCDSNCEAEFIVGKSASRNFTKELNDHSTKEVTIQFKVPAKLVRIPLTLDIRTLYSFHLDNDAGQIDNFQMRIALD